MSFTTYIIYYLLVKKQVIYVTYYHFTNFFTLNYATAILTITINPYNYH